MTVCGFYSCAFRRDDGSCTDLDYEDQCDYCLRVVKYDDRPQKARDAHYREHHAYLRDAPAWQERRMVKVNIAWGTAVYVCYQCGEVIYKDVAVDF